MSETHTKNIYEKINNLYSKTGFMDRYGSDVWLTVFIVLCFVFYILYFYFMNSVEIIRSDWDNQKCNPAIMPFAGFINKPDDESNIEFTAKNFANCINLSLKNIISIIIQPLVFAATIINASVNELIESAHYLRMFVDYFRNAITHLFKAINSAMLNFILAFIQFIITIKDSIAKINGILTASLYTLLGSYLSMKSLFMSIINFVTLILRIITLGMFDLYQVINNLINIPIIGSALAIIPILIYVLWFGIFSVIIIPILVFKIMMERVLRMQTIQPPGYPQCFAENTPIKLYKNDTCKTDLDQCKKIKHIDIGDILENGSVVTAIFILSSDGQDIYNLNNVIVSGEHRVLHPTLKWIKIKDHPDSIYVHDFKEPFLYCLNTNKKEFLIGDTVYSDWDDIDSNVLDDLNKNCVSAGYLPTNFNNSDIHTYLESGLHGDTFIILNNGKTTKLKDIEVNDELLSGDKVRAIIKIASHDVNMYVYKFNSDDDNTFLCSTRNIHINDDNLGIINVMNLEGISIPSENSAYHLLTDTGFFVANNIRIHDYNSGIDAYLSKK